MRLLNPVGEKKRGKCLYWMVQLPRRLHRFFYYRDCSTEAEAVALYRLNQLEKFNRVISLGWEGG